MFKFRIISFIALLGIFAFVYYNRPYGMYLFFFLVALAAFGMVNELGRMVEKLDMPSFLPAAGLYAALFAWFFSHKFYDNYQIMAAVLAIPIIFGWGTVLCGGQFALNAKRLTVSAGLLLLTLPVICGMSQIGAFDMRLFVYFVLVTKAGDTGAYCVGMLSNKLNGGRNHPVAPRISPKKSIEGTLGGLIIAVGVSFLLGSGLGVVTFDKIWLAIFGIVLFWGGFFGDLTESVLKRGCGIKDSGKILPGMGGVWDVMDSFIYNAPLFCLIFPFLPLN